MYSIQIPEFKPLIQEFDTSEKLTNHSYQSFSNFKYFDPKYYHEYEEKQIREKLNADHLLLRIRKRSPYLKTLKGIHRALAPRAPGPSIRKLRAQAGYREPDPRDPRDLGGSGANNKKKVRFAPLNAPQYDEDEDRARGAPKKYYRKKAPPELSEHEKDILGKIKKMSRDPAKKLRSRK